MSLRQRLTSYLVALHLIFFVFTVVLYHEQPKLFIALEVLLAASLVGGFHLIKRALEPLGYTQRFHDLLQEQNYASRLQASGNTELDKLVDLFNTMLGALYQERLELGEQQGFLDRLLEATPSAVLVFDFDGNISLLNASATSLLGLEQAKGKPLRHWVDGGGSWSKRLDELGQARCQSLLAQLDGLPLGEARLLSDTEGRRYRGQRGQFFDRGFARHFLLVEELTAELESSERAAYEKLIRVLAHEVNNTVAATGSVLDSLLFYTSQLSERDRTDFTTAIVAVKRRNVSLGEFIERFTSVLKMPEPELRPASLKDMMEDILWLNREQCKGRGVRIGWVEGSIDAGKLLMDRHLMEQALINIVKNAIEAVQATQDETGASGGHVDLVLASEEKGMRLSVIDSGNRLGEVPERQLFTPFFSTKKGGQGIGLLFVREVLKRHNFPYRLAADGQGNTRFDIWFSNGG
jgi:two-component system nitrogen regulation sensor histidine kinase NtrY